MLRVNKGKEIVISFCLCQFTIEVGDRGAVVLVVRIVVDFLHAPMKKHLGVFLKAAKPRTWIPYCPKFAS